MSKLREAAETAVGIVARAVLLLMMVLTVIGVASTVSRCEASSRTPKDSVVLLTSTKGYTCGGTVVAPRVILTADHCVDEDSGTVAKVDGKPVTPVLIESDATDHALIVLADKLPNPVARWNRSPRFFQGTELHFWGSPGSHSDLYRRGYVMGTCEATRCLMGAGWDAKVTMVELPVYYGDSGSGVFNERNELVGVVSVFVVFSPVVHPMGLLPVTFTEGQLKRTLG